MTVSRSFAPPREADEASPAPPVFPLLPFAYTAYAEHCSRDMAGYVGRLAQVEEKPEAPEDPFGLQMLTDMNQAFLSLVWAPLGAALDRSRTDVRS